jgi:predicted nucleic acid-binding protein
MRVRLAAAAVMVYNGSCCPGFSLLVLFCQQVRLNGDLAVDSFASIPDRADRKFAALSKAAGAVLVAANDHLLAKRDQGDIEVLTQTEFWAHHDHG